MFKIGDVIVYSVHGLCQIDDICDKTIANVTKTYYVLHPLAEQSLTISIPVDNDKVLMLETMNREEGEEILHSFKQPGLNWIGDIKLRTLRYREMIKNGDRRKIAKVANTLMRKNQELTMVKKRLYDQDRRILNTIQNLLFKELAMTLNTSDEKIYEMIHNMINEEYASPLKEQA
jgi:CarD family transcriptional regulator